MKVKATKAGFFGNAHRAVGAVFDIEDGDFTASWMEQVEEEKPKPKSRSRAKKSEDE